MENKKIKILFVCSDLAGVGHFRNIWPAQQMQKDFADEFQIEINASPNTQNLAYMKSFDIIHFHRHLGPYEGSEELFNELRKSGTILLMDIDDYWDPPKTHPLYGAAQQEQLPKKITHTFKMVDYVTTTTDIFAKYISKFNKNVLIMPNAIDPGHKMWIGDDVKPTDKLRISWIGGSCYDNKTEVLTENGFKFFKDLMNDEKIACLNPKTNELEYHKPLAHIKEKFNGKLQCGINNTIDYAVSPNHNMYVSISENISQKKLNYSLIPSENIFGKNFHIKKDCIWNGIEEKNMIIPGLFKNDDNNYEELLKECEYANFNNEDLNLENKFKIRESKFGKKFLSKSVRSEELLKDKKVEMDLWLKFFGFWIAEGWTTKTDGLYQVGVAQVKNNGFLEEIFETLQKMGYNPTYTKDGNQVRVFDKQLWKYLSQFGKAENKFVPKEILNLSNRQLKIFLDWYLKGDGSSENGGVRFDKRYNKIVKYNSDRKRAYTVSKILADNIQEICLKIGVSSTITNRGLRNSTMKDGRKVFAKHDAYTISIGSSGKRAKTNVLVKKDAQFEQEYNGFIYCVNVPNNIIFVRRNGKTMWCGNSHKNDLEPIAGSMKLLHEDESLKNKYQMVMCGFDIRGHITEIHPDGKQTTRKIQPHETVWNLFEEIFTGGYKCVSDEYKSWLKKYKNEPYPFGDLNNETYVRRWTLPLTQYGRHYSYCDVCMAPLVDNIFNEVKSELKIIESGMKKKVLIAQDFGIYKEIIKDGENGFLIPKNANATGWYEKIKLLINDRTLVEKLSNNLHEYVKDKYSLKNATKERVEAYRSIIKKREEQNKAIEQEVE